MGIAFGQKDGKNSIGAFSALAHAHERDWLYASVHLYCTPERPTSREIQLFYPAAGTLPSTREEMKLQAVWCIKVLQVPKRAVENATMRTWGLDFRGRAKLYPGGGRQVNKAFRKLLFASAQIALHQPLLFIQPPCLLRPWGEHLPSQASCIPLFSWSVRKTVTVQKSFDDPVPRHWPAGVPSFPLRFACLRHSVTCWLRFLSLSLPCHPSSAGIREQMGQRASRDATPSVRRPLLSCLPCLHA